MRKLIALFMVLFFLLAIGCAKKEEAATAPPVAEPLPPMSQVDPSAEENIVPPVASNEEQVVAPIGNRVTGEEPKEEKPAIVETAPVEGEILLTPEKTMTESVMSVSQGTTLFWKNTDSWPHLIAVESGKGFETVRHAASPRLLQGNTWNYTFNEKGAFIVRDTFSGSMRMNVTVN